VSAGRSSRARTALRWLLGVLLALDVLALLGALSLAQLSSEGTARRALRHAVAALTEVDILLDRGYGELRDQAAAGGREPLTLNDFPIEVSFSAEEIRRSDRVSFRSTLLDQAAERVHQEGPSAFEGEGDRTQEASDFSWRGATRRGLNALREDVRPASLSLTAGLAAGAALLGAGVVLAGGGIRGLVTLGVSLLAAATLGLALLGATYLALWLAGPDDYLGDEFSALVRALLWAPLRNAGVVCALGLALVAGGAALGRLDARRSAAARLTS